MKYKEKKRYRKIVYRAIYSMWKSKEPTYESFIKNEKYFIPYIKYKEKSKNLRVDSLTSFLELAGYHSSNLKTLCFSVDCMKSDYFLVKKTAIEATYNVFLNYLLDKTKEDSSCLILKMQSYLLLYLLGYTEDINNIIDLLTHENDKVRNAASNLIIYLHDLDIISSKDIKNICRNLQYEAFNFINDGVSRAVADYQSLTRNLKDIDNEKMRMDFVLNEKKNRLKARNAKNTFDVVDFLEHSAYYSSNIETLSAISQYMSINDSIIQPYAIDAFFQVFFRYLIKCAEAKHSHPGVKIISYMYLYVVGYAGISDILYFIDDKEMYIRCNVCNGIRDLSWTNNVFLTDILLIKERLQKRRIVEPSLKVVSLIDQTIKEMNAYEARMRLQ